MHGEAPLMPSGCRASCVRMGASPLNLERSRQRTAWLTRKMIRKKVTQYGEAFKSDGPVSDAGFARATLVFAE
jgi:hypothetical protein